jgi:hypothetical protein
MQSAKMQAETNRGSIQGPLGIDKIKFDAYKPENKGKFKLLLQEAVTDMRLVPASDSRLHYRRFAKIITRKRTGEVVALEMMTPSPGAGLDKRMAQVLVLATKMELTSIELEV